MNPTRNPMYSLRMAAMIPVVGTALLLGGLVPGVARADNAPPNGKTVCLDVNRIDHTQVLNDHQILFHMVNGKIWQNNLTVPCRTLTSQDGFSWESGIPKFCGNVEQIRVLRTGESCLLGPFVAYVPGGASPQGTSASLTTDRDIRPN